MRNRIALLLIGVLLCAAVSSVEIGSNVNTVRILSVSTLLDTDNSARVGSIEGGTRLYIKIVGHDSTLASNNSIYIGSYPCEIPDMGVNEVFITCITTAPNSSDYEVALNVVVQVVNRSDSQCAQEASLCTFTYKASSTPILDQVIPRVSSSNNIITWRGIFRITNLNQIGKMLIGDQICDRYYISLNENSAYAGSSYGSLDCSVGLLTQAGYYVTSFTSLPGTSQNPSRLTTVKSTTLDTAYQYQIIPNITAISHSKVTSGGAILNITAYGLPLKASEVSVDFNGNTCNVLDVSQEYKSLTCQLIGPLSNPASSSTLFTQGSGVRYQSYSTSMWSIDSAVSDYHSTSKTNTLLSDKIIGTTEVYVAHDSNDGVTYPRIVAVLSGYFTAPRTGVYYFQTAASYQSKFFIQTSGTSTDPTTMKLLTQTVEGTDVRTPYSRRFSEQTTVSEGITLTSGQAYYFESFGLASSTTSFYLSNGVRIPSGSTNSYPNTSGQVTQVSIVYPFTKEVISITHQDLASGTTGTFNIYFIAPYGTTVSTKATYWSTPSTAFSKNSACTDLTNHFQWYLQDVRSTCVKTNVLDSSSNIIGATWTLTFKQHRKQIKPSFVFDSTVSSKPVFTVITAPGADLSGTFKLTLNTIDLKVGSSTAIPYSTSAGTLEYYIQKALGTTDIEVNSLGNAADGFTYYIDFFGITSEVPVEVNSGSLVGESGVSISMTVTQLRAADNTLNYISIENNLLSQLGSVPTVTLTIEDSKSICVASSGCQLTVISDSAAPSYTSFSDNETLKQVTLSGVSLATGSSSITDKDFSVTYNGVLLQTISYDSTNQQVIAQYVNRTAGTYKPILDLAGYGAALSPSVSATIVLPVISSLSKSSINTFGGSTLVITGKYFPLSGVKVTIDGVQANVTDVQNTQITLFTPVLTSTGTKDVIVIANALSSVAFQITADNSKVITITGISNTTPSPVAKTLVTVYGTNFGTDKSLLAAYLDLYDSDGTTIKIQGKYNVNVVSASDISVQLLFGGGAAGNYRLRIVEIGTGSNDPNTSHNQIQYNIFVTALSRTTSSKYGGATLTITGSNFATTTTDNQVLIVYSSSASELCTVTSATAVQLKCTLPDMSSHFSSTSTSTTFSIEIWGLLIVQAIVPSGNSLTLAITYQNSLTPQVTGLSASSGLAGSNISVLGTSLPTSISDISVFAIGYASNPCTVVSSDGSTVIVTLPFLEYSTSYSLVLATADGNSASQTFTLSQGVINSASSQAVASGGKEIQLVLSGLLASEDPIFQFNSLTASVLSYTAATGTVKLRLPATSTGSYKLNFARSSSLTLNSDASYPWQIYSTAFTVIASTATITAAPTISGQTVSIQGTGLASIISGYLQAPDSPKTKQYASTSLSTTATTGTIVFSSAPAGLYTLYLLDSSSNYPSFSTSTFNSITIELPDSASLTASGSLISSYAGGQTFTIAGSGFNADSTSLNVVKICGSEAAVVSATNTLLTLTTPAVFTSHSISTYSFDPSVNKLSGFTTFGDDSTADSTLISDGDLLFAYKSTNSASCYVGVDFGSVTQAILDHFELYPLSQGVTDASALFGTVFQGSNDKSTWTDIVTIGTDFHLGKNLFLIDTLINAGASTDIKNSFRYFRLYDSTGLSACQLVEVKLFGWKSTSIVEASNTLTCPISLAVNGSTLRTLSSSISYQDAVTFLVSSISPSYGQITGGTSVTITLNKAATGTVSVTIDGIACLNPTLATSTTITCTTANKSTSTTPSSATSLVVTINGQVAVTNDVYFYYGYLWSSDDTWGGDFAPITGDLVYVTDGKVIIVDVAYIGILNTVIVEEATMIFANNMNIHFEAYNIIVKTGKIIIGTEDAPITGTVRITMYGTSTDTQFPTIGNKGLSVYNGSIDIQGIPRTVTWTELSTTASKGDTSITVYLKDVSGFDWAIGEVIVIASTDFSHGHAERRTITGITKSSSTAVITFDEPLLVKHVSITETYNGVSIDMRAEVGLLSRNVIFEGDSSSETTLYGAHIMLHGNSTTARIRHAEFRKTGQPKIIGRYPIHFHMVGDVSGSIVEGNAVHDSYARVLTIHNTHYLHVLNNVGYNCAGHNIFLEDGIETNNIIEENLMLGTKQVWSMLQSDITCASYWITNPLNTVINNRSGGSDFYGFWYEIKEHPDGPSARNDICPQGMALGKFEGNKAHSNDRFGLRIFVMNHLKYPCTAYRDDSLENPFSANPSYQIVWKNFVSYRNHEDGVLAEEIGNMVFDQFYLLDNKQSGFNSYLTNRTDEEVILQNSIIVGKTVGNHATDGELDLTRGLITPRTDGFKANNVHFANFDGTMTVFKSVSFGYHIKKWVTGGKLSRFNQISYSGISSDMMYWENWRREIYEDMDGSMTLRNVPSWITPSGAHLTSQTECATTATEAATWDDAVICSKQVVRIEFSNPEKLSEFSSVALFAQAADSTGTTLGGTDTSQYYVSKSVLIENAAHDLTNGFVGTFLTGKIFSVQWQLTQIDFTHMSVQLSPYHRGTGADDTIILKFPYTDYRETFEIGKMLAGTIPSFYANVTSSLTDQQSSTALTTLLSRNCNHGDWYNHVAGKAFYLCLNQNGRTSGSTNQILERTDVNALACKYNCPLPVGECVKDGISRKLSDTTTWQSIPDPETPTTIYNSPGDTDLTIPCPWELVIDQDLTAFKRIIVLGTLRIDPTKSINISVEGIYNQGTIVAEGATTDSPYTNNLSIELLGVRTTSTQFIIASDIQVGNKVIANVGTIKLIGNPPSTLAARLTAPLEKGSTTITVDSASGWAVGDTLAIAPTQLTQTENESFIISAISGTTITLKTAASYYHYGAASATITETWTNGNSETLDLRAQVLHLTRNIKIYGNDTSTTALQWGCRVLNYYWVIESDSNGNTLDVLDQTHLKGILNWNGVEMQNCGQADTTRGAIDFNLAQSDEDNTMSIVTNSAIYNCPGVCINIEESADITLTNNNIYNSRPISLRIYDASNLIVQNNHFIAALVRDYTYDTTGMVYDFTGHIYFYSATSVINNSILITGNIAQGSQGPCLVFPHVYCSEASSFSQTIGIYDNSASSCYIGAIYNLYGDGTCQWAGRISVARSERGIIVNPTAQGIIVENVLAAENTRSIILRFANEATDNTGIFRYSSVYGVAIMNDATAYDTAAKATACQGTIGTQNLVVTKGGSAFPLKIDPINYDVICNSEVFDSHLHQVNVKYYNFKITYTDTNLSLCSNNMMMATHPSASDATAGTYNTDVTCSNCNTDSYFLFRSPSSSWLGWFGGCGLFLCTGPENVVNVDFTGALFSNVPTTAISHNSGIAAATCTKQSNWNNGYSCPGTNYVQLEWESQASDHNTRSTAPVYLKSDDSLYSNKINMYREWEWDGSEPLNLRENRFLSTTLANTRYTITYNGLNPYNIIHKIQRRVEDTSGESNVYVIISSEYDISQNIEASLDDGTVIDSYLPTDEIDLSTKTTICGANTYNYKTRTIEFVITGDASCIVRLKVLDTVRIHVKVTITVAQFFSNSSISFLSTVAAYLGIDYSQIKIVGASTASSRFLTESSSSGFELVIDIVDKTTSTTTSAATTYATLSGYATTLSTALASDSITGLAAGTYSVISSSTIVSTDTNGGVFGQTSGTTATKTTSSSSDSTLAIVLGIVIGLIVISIAVVSYCAYKRYKQRKNLIALQNHDGDVSSADIKAHREQVKVVPMNVDPTAVQAIAAVDPTVFDQQSVTPQQVDEHSLAPHPVDQLDPAKETLKS